MGFVISFVRFVVKKKLTTRDTRNCTKDTMELVITSPWNTDDADAADF